MVSAVSFRSFRFDVSPFSTCHHEQGGISFSTNQRFCLHFCPKPIRMRKTLHHMKFVNKRMGLLQSFSASGFLGFCHEIDICCS